MQTNLCCRCLHALLTIQTIWFGPFVSLNLIHLLIKMTHIMGSKLLSWVAGLRIVCFYRCNVQRGIGMHRNSESVRLKSHRTDGLTGTGAAAGILRFSEGLCDASEPLV